MPIDSSHQPSALQRLKDGARERVVFIEDDVPLTADELLLKAQDFAETLAREGIRRFAVFSNRPTMLALAILGAECASAEVLLMRAALSLDDPYWSDVGVEAVLGEEGDLDRVAAVRPDFSGPGPAVLIPTSGTSGRPKLCHHSIGSLLGRIRPPRSRSEEARWLLTYLPSSFAGLQVILTALATKSSAVCLRRMELPLLAAAAVSHNVTHISGTPTFWRAFLLCLGREAEKLDLKQITLGGEVADQHILDRLHATFPNAGLSHIYASTEAGALFSVRDGRAGFPAQWLEESVDGVSLRICEGVLEVKSPRAMLGYVNQELPVGSGDGWWSTGDHVERQEDRVYFLGRQDTLINVGGAKTTPEEVEAALFGIPGILDLRAFGVRNPITGFVVGLEVVAAPGFDLETLRREITMTARRKLAAYKAPRVIRFAEAVGRDPGGKKSRRTE